MNTEIRTLFEQAARAAVPEPPTSPEPVCAPELPTSPEPAESPHVPPSPNPSEPVRSPNPPASLEPPDVPNPTASPATSDAPEPPEPPVSPEALRDQAVLEYAVRTAAEGCGARDPELVEFLLGRAEIAVEDGTVTGLAEALERLRRERPYLFQDGGKRPVFAAPVRGRRPDHEEETVARRYQNNPWYRRR